MVSLPITYFFLRLNAINECLMVFFFLFIFIVNKWDTCCFCLYMEQQHTICIFIHLHRVSCLSHCYFFPLPRPSHLSFPSIQSLLPPFFPPSHPPLCVIIRLSVRSFVFWIFEIGLSHLA